MAADQRRARISRLSVVGLRRLTGIIYPNACTIAAVRWGQSGAGQTCSGSAQTKSTEGSMGAIRAGDRRCAISEGGMVIMQAFEQSRLPAAATSQRQSLAALSFGKGNTVMPDGASSCFLLTSSASARGQRGRTTSSRRFRRLLYSRSECLGLGVLEVADAHRNDTEQRYRNSISGALRTNRIHPPRRATRSPAPSA